MTEYVYSLDNETYHELESFLDNVLDYDESSINPDMELYKAEKVLRTHSSFINANSILETISQNAYDESGEYAEVYCSKLDYTPDSKLQELKQLINNFLDNYIGQPDFYTVRNAIKIQYKDLNANT